MSRSEELMHDIASAIPAEVVQQYVPSGEFASSQLSLDVGDLIWVLEQHESGWWGGHKEGDTSMGWFPKDAVRLTRSQSPCSLPICTNDRRAVASPMGARTTSVSESKAQALQEKNMELSQLNRKLQQDLDAKSQDLEQERKLRCDEVEVYKAKNGHVLKQLAALSSDFERAKHEFRQREASLAERCRELEREVSRLQEEHRKKEEATQQQIQQQHQQNQMLLQQFQQLQQHHQLQQQGSSSRVAAGHRAPSTEAPRRLFESSSWTPPVPVQSQTSHSPAVATATSATMVGSGGSVPVASLPHHLQTPGTPGSSGGSASVALGAGGATGGSGPAVSLCSGGSLAGSGGCNSARAHHPPHPHQQVPQSQPQSQHSLAAPAPTVLSRPSPRAVASSSPSPVPCSGVSWLQQPATLPPPSPHRIHRYAVSSEAAQVRSLVSEFERRSNSQGALPRMDPSPSRQYFVAGSSRPVATATVRSGSRDARANYQATDVVNVPDEVANQCANQSVTAPFNFGMSPMQRQVLPASRMASPSAHPSVSVQDRIRQFTGVRCLR